MDIVLIIVQNKKKELFVHKRSPDKKLYPNLYGLGAGGVVEESERIHDAAKRELFEELGIDVTPKKLFDFFFEDKTNPHFVHVYFIEYDRDIDATCQEFNWSGWMTFEELNQIKDKLIPDTIIAYEKFKQLSK